MTTKLAELVNHKAYFDASHPEHAAIKKQAQEESVRMARDGGHVDPMTTIMTRWDVEKVMNHPDKEMRDDVIELDRLMKSPAYFDARHPDHLTTKTQVNEWFQSATAPAEQ